MWFLILFPVMWLVSEITKMNRPARVALVILAIAATAWLTYDVCTSEWKARERMIRHDLTPKPHQTN